MINFRSVKLIDQVNTMQELDLTEQDKRLKQTQPKSGSARQREPLNNRKSDRATHRDHEPNQIWGKNDRESRYHDSLLNTLTKADPVIFSSTDVGSGRHVPKRQSMSEFKPESSYL